MKAVRSAVVKILASFSNVSVAVLSFARNAKVNVLCPTARNTNAAPVAARRLTKTKILSVLSPNKNVKEDFIWHTIKFTRS